jgi:hypothetical protein
LLGKLFEKALPGSQEQFAVTMTKAVLDLKPEQATMEADLAKWAASVGSLDYMHARLSVTQARDPRYDPFAGYDWARIS